MGHRASLERWFAGVWGERDERVIDELMAEDCHNDGLGDAHGREGFRRFFRTFSGAFKKSRIAVEEVIEDGERFACRCSAILTDQDGVDHAFEGCVFGKVRNGQFIQTRNHWDFLGLLEKTHTIPAGSLGTLVERQIARATGKPQRTHRQFMERWFAELWGARNAAIIDECVAEDCKIAGLPDTTDSRASFRAFFQSFGAAFPEVHIEVEECVESGEQFAIRCNGHIRDQAGNKHPFTGSCVGRVRGGQFVEASNHWDFLGLLDSMGAIEKDALSKTIQAHAAKAR